MSYKKVPSISSIQKKEQKIAEGQAFEEYWKNIYRAHPEIKIAMDEYFKNEIKNK